MHIPVTHDLSAWPVDKLWDVTVVIGVAGVRSCPHGVHCVDGRGAVERGALVNINRAGTPTHTHSQVME